MVYRNVLVYVIGLFIAIRKVPRNYGTPVCVLSNTVYLIYMIKN